MRGNALKQQEPHMAIEVPRDFRRVIIAASVGNVIEWYDFYIFGSLAAVLSVKFFEQSHPVAALLIPDPPVRGIPVRMDGRPDRAQIYVPGYAQRNGIGYGGDRVDPDLRVDRSDRRLHSFRLADDPGPVPRR